MPQHDGMKTTLLERLASEICDEHFRTDSCYADDTKISLCYDDNGCSNESRATAMRLTTLDGSIA